MSVHQAGMVQFVGEQHHIRPGKTQQGTQHRDVRLPPRPQQHGSLMALHRRHPRLDGGMRLQRAAHQARRSGAGA
jgi:hypothetical protein